MRIQIIINLIICLCAISCGNQKNETKLISCGDEPMPKYDYRATVQGEMTPEIDSILRIEKKRDVFKPCRTITYRAKFYNEKGGIISNETIEVTPTGSRWEYQPEKQDEITINYYFNPDSVKYVNSFQLNKSSLERKWQNQEITGIIENVEKIWTHPFRSNQYNFTQVAPFPQIELPIEIGKKWSDNKISLREGFGDWSNIKVKSEFEVIEKNHIQTEYGEFENSWKIRAISIFPLGQSELVYWYNADFGFVKLEYINYGNQRLDIEIIEVRKNGR